MDIAVILKTDLMYNTSGLLRTELRILLRTKDRCSMPFRRIAFMFKPKNLLLTNTLSSGMFMFVGDIAQQQFEIQQSTTPQQFEWGRSVRMLLVGCFMGPFHHYYYVKLDKLMPHNDLKTVIKKIVCDQLIASPLTILFFFVGMGLLEKKSVQEINNEVVYKFKYTYLGDCCFWPPIQFINFYYLPSKYRVFYINGATMLFNVFLSYIKHFDQHK